MTEPAIYIDEENTAVAPLRGASDSMAILKQNGVGGGEDEYCEVGEPSSAIATTVLDGGEKNARQLRLIDKLFNKSCERRRAKFEALVEQEKLRSHNTLHK